MQFRIVTFLVDSIQINLRLLSDSVNSEAKVSPLRITSLLLIAITIEVLKPPLITVSFVLSLNRASIPARFPINSTLWLIIIPKLKSPYLHKTVPPIEVTNSPSLNFT